MKAEIAGLHFTHSDYMIIYAHFFSEFDMYIFMYGFLYLQKKQKQRHIPGHSQPHPRSLCQPKVCTETTFHRGQ